MPVKKSASYLNLDWNGTLHTGKPKEIKKKTSGRDKSWYYLGLIGEVGFSIALPIVGGALLGKFLDQKFLIYPKATLSLLVLGIFVSIANLINLVKRIY